MPPPRGHGRVEVFVALDQDAIGDLCHRFFDAMVDRILLPRHVVVEIESVRCVHDSLYASELCRDAPQHRSDRGVGMHQVVVLRAHELAELQDAFRVWYQRYLSVDRDFVNGVAPGAEFLYARVRRAGRLDRESSPPEVVDLGQQQGLETERHRADVEHLDDGAGV